MGADRQNLREIAGELGELDDIELAKEYLRTRGGRDVGEEVMRRVVDYAGKDTDEYLDRLLKSDDGKILKDEDGDPIPAGRYLPDGVAKHRPEFRKIATKGVLDFLVSGHRDPVEREAMASMLDQRTLDEGSS
jgi:hypothetical protein